MNTFAKYMNTRVNQTSSSKPTMNIPSVLKKFLTAKVLVHYVLYDHDDKDYDLVSWTEAQWNKRTTVPHYHIVSNGSKGVVEPDDLIGGGPSKLDYEDRFVPITKLEPVDVVKVAGNWLHPDCAARVKRETMLRVNLDGEIGYTVRIDFDSMKIGCQRLTWAEWAGKKGKELLNQHVYWRDEEIQNEHRELLSQVLANKDVILARLTGEPLKKNVVKKVAKKAVKKAPEKKKVAAKKRK